MKISGRHLLVLVAMCGLIASGIGLVTNVSGLFFTPVADEFGILKGSASLMLTICNVALAIGGMLVPRLLNERTLKPVLIGATATLAASTAALAVCPSIMPMYLLSAVRGFAAGFVTFVFVTSVLNNWFVANIGLATSIAMGCSGLAGAAFSPVVNGIIQSMGWRAGFVVLGVLTVVLNLPAILFLPALDPKSVGLEPLGASEAAVATTAKSQDESSKASPINMAVLGAVIAYALFASAVTALPQHFPGLCESYALGTALGASMLSLCMIANTAGKIVLGALIDKAGTKLSVLLYAALVAAGLALMLVMRSSQMLLFSAVLVGLVYSLGTVGISMLTRDAFGLANYGRTYPTVTLVGNMANAAFSSIVGFMYDFTGGYTLTLLMFLAMMVAVIALVVFVYGQKPKAA
ncbi:MAG: MFS transporter [Atopobiaceae bacterium]|nr:MFS transporter [Atopobiaceae bacterium]